MNKILQGDCREVLKTLPDCSVNCCITSPPYYGLRDYGVDGQIGLEQTTEAYVAELVAVFREVRRVLRNDGTLWLNLGDSYAAQRGGTGMPAETLAGGAGGHGDELSHRGRGSREDYNPKRNASKIGLKHKDLIGIPWMVAFALRADGWYLRQDIIWNKPNPMPESVTDRCTKAHEYVFLMTKSAKYWYDAEAIKEPATGWNGNRFDDGKNLEAHPNVGKNRDNSGTRVHGNLPGRGDGGAACNKPGQETRNKRSVWTVATQPYKQAHFATFPPDLIRPMVLAGCPQGGTILDPFGGSGTTGEVAETEGRNSILIELNPKYIELQKLRTAQAGLFCLETVNAPTQNHSKTLNLTVNAL